MSEERDGKCEVEVYKDENEERRIGLICTDLQGNETMRVGCSVKIAKELAYKVLNFAYRIEHGISITGDRAPEQDEQDDYEDDGEEE